ncbi:hypothetical protein D3C83_16510 [compost metagenome]
MVPKVTPRNWCERIFTQSKNSLIPCVNRLSLERFLISSQSPLMSSYISEVMAPRTVRAFSRADWMQE